MNNNIAKLQVLEGGKVVQEVPITKRDMLIGREPGNDVIINHPQVSRQQARLKYNGRNWVLENLSPNNPVKMVLNNAAGQPINNGEQFMIGPLTITLVLANAQGQLAPPPPEARPTTLVHQAPQAVAGTMLLTDQDRDGKEDHGYGTMVMSGPALQVDYEGTSREYRLETPRITIGPAQNADIIIPLPSPAPFHAILNRLPTGQYVITDPNNTYNLFYKGQRVGEVRLLDGDMVRLSDPEGNVATLTFTDSLNPAPALSQVFQFQPNMAQVTIGRAPNNAFVLDYPPVSGYHAIIRRDGPNGDAILQDLGSTNGTFVHGQRVKPQNPVRIKPGDLVQIAGIQLIYQPDVIAQPASDQLRLDAIGVTKAVNDNQLILLNDVSLSIQPKEFVAIVGGSGTGKSTLMDALNGFRPAPVGRVFINGEDYYQNFEVFRSSLGYVPQEDIIHRDLPVEQALFYVAKLRLPKDTTGKEIKQRVNEVLEDVEMSSRRKVVVSKLSGGQRKRISIAVELLAKPNLFYLDEPTSGLDPGLDKRMMFLLRRLADQGRTIILITHATTNITTCDKVIFMAPGGRLCFYGPPQQALDFFGVKEFADIYSKLEQNGPEWEARFRNSLFYQQYVLQRLSELRPTQINAPVSEQRARAPRISSWRQFGILTRRYTNILIRDRVNLLVLLLQAPIIGFILALVAGENIFANGKSPANAQQVLFIMAIAAVWLGTSNAAREITKETPVYLRERLVNLRVVPYILSKVAVLSVLCLIQSIILAGVVMLRAGVPPTGSLLPPAIEMIIGVWLTTLGGLGMGLLISALASNMDKATSVVPIILVPQIILAGIIFPLSGPSQVLSYITVSKWSIDSLGTSADVNRLFYQQVGDQPPGFTGNGGTFDPANYDRDPSARKYPPLSPTITSQSSRAQNLVLRWGVLLGITVLFIVLAGYFQKRKDKAWQRR